MFMSFFRNRNQDQKLARGVYTIRRGITRLNGGDFDGALQEFRKVIASRNPKTTRLVRSVASFYAYNTERLRKEFKKSSLGNAHLMEFKTVSARDAWSDVDIAAVLVAPQDSRLSRLLCGFLGRSPEAVRFQRRYVFANPLGSWRRESGNRYTRFTQSRNVAKELGLL